MDLFPKEYKTKDDALGAENKSAGSSFGKINLKSLNFAKFSGFGETALRLGIVICGILLVLALLLWGGMFYYKNSLNNQITELQKQQANVFSAKDKEAAANIVGLAKSADVAKGLLKAHLFVSQAFDKLAGITLPRVQWQSLGISAADSSIKTTGLAGNYSILAKQIMSLEEGGFKGVSVDNIKLDKLGGVTFSANFNFDPKIILRKQ